MKCFTCKSAFFIGLVFLVLCAGQAIALEVDAGEPQVVAMHDVTDPNGPVDPNLLDPKHPTWPMAFSTNPSSPLTPRPVVAQLDGSHDANTPAAVAWTHLALTFDSSQRTFYLNGVQVFAEPVAEDFSAGDLVTPMVIGYRWNNKSRYFMGAIDEVRIYDYALSADELQAIYTTDQATMPTL